MSKNCVDCPQKEKKSIVDGSYDNWVNAVVATAAKLNGRWCLVLCYQVMLCSTVLQIIILLSMN
jgi:hypothetical protein